MATLAEEMCSQQIKSRFSGKKGKKIVKASSLLCGIKARSQPLHVETR